MTLSVVPDPAPVHDVALLDLSYLHRRAWHSTSNEVTSTAYTETVRACHAWRELATHVLICLDSPPYRRAKLLPSYKANREKAPKELIDQLKRIVDRLKQDGFPILAAAGYEADDVIATACAQLSGMRIAVVTGDKDARQLVGGGVQVVDPSTLQHYDTAAVVEKHGVLPAMIPELLALMGDSSDNIPGVDRIGDKTAAELLTTYGSLAGILANTHQLSAAKVKALEDARTDVYVWLQVAQLETDAPIDVRQYLNKEIQMADTVPTNGNGQHSASKQLAPRYDFRRKVERIKPPARIVVYGEPGIGKTTFGTESPNPVLVPTEDGALAVTHVPRVPVDGKARDWADLIEAVKTIATVDHDFKNLVMDTLNGAYALCARMVCERDFGGVWASAKDTEGYNAFGKGDSSTAKEFKALLDWLDICQQKRGMGVILLAHVGLQKQGNALGQDFHKFTADVGKKTWEIVCAWADQVGHACREFRATTIDKEKKAKATAQGVERWLVFEGGPARDCKARVGYELPEKILLSWEEYEMWSKTDRIGLLVDQAQDLLTTARPDAVSYVQGRVGGAINPDSLRAMGAGKLDKMINWLLSQQPNSQGAST